jgi:hypothetical protein
MTSPRPERWSQRVAATSNALDFEPGVFTLEDPRAIARSRQDFAPRTPHEARR